MDLHYLIRSRASSTWHPDCTLIGRFWLHEVKSTEASVSQKGSWCGSRESEDTSIYLCLAESFLAHIFPEEEHLHFIDLLQRSQKVKVSSRVNGTFIKAKEQTRTPPLTKRRVPQSSSPPSGCEVSIITPLSQTNTWYSERRLVLHVSHVGMGRWLTKCIRTWVQILSTYVKTRHDSTCLQS